MEITKELLEEMYYNKNLTLREIGGLIGTKGVSYYFTKFGIKTNGPEKTALNIDESLLRKMYLEEDLKAEEISERIGICTATVLKYIHKYNIPIKGIRHYNVLQETQFTEEQYEFFDGLILSDGSLVAQKVKYGNGYKNAKISCGFKHKEFAVYINDFLDLGGNVHKKIHVSDRYKTGQCVQFGLMSKNNILFTNERQRWYPNGKKIIPEDFRFSPVSMNIVYLSDGHLDKYHIILSTQSFDRESIERLLIEKLREIKIECWITKNNEIYIASKSVADFLNYIGPCPVECYRYKWGDK